METRIKDSTIQKFKRRKKQNKKQQKKKTTTTTKKKKPTKKKKKSYIVFVFERNIKTNLFIYEILRRSK